MMTTKEQILDLYFNKHLKQNEIAKITKVTTQYISKVIKRDLRYEEEKSKRKEHNKEKHIENTKKIIKAKRKKEQFENNVDDLILKKMHNQASIELSGAKVLSNMAYRNCNKSAYRYNVQKKRFEFREELGRCYAVPKYIKVKI